MLACLSTSGALPAITFDAALHKRRFAWAQEKYPAPPTRRDNLETSLSPGIASALVRFAGPGVAEQLRAASTRLRGRMRAVPLSISRLVPAQVLSMPDGLGRLSLHDVRLQNSVRHFSCPTDRRKAAAALVAGRVYVLGGHTSGGTQDDETTLASADCLDVIAGVWKALTPMIDRRSGAAAAGVCSTGDVFVAGGRSERDHKVPYLASAERYDASRKLWVPLPCMHHQRFCAAATTVSGRLFVIGGWEGNANAGTLLRSIECFDDVVGSWQVLPPMSCPRFKAVAVGSGDGRILVMGGNYKACMECYDPASRTWAFRSPLRRWNCWVSTAVSADGKVFVAGRDRTVGTTLECYDVATDVWAALPSVRDIPSPSCCRSAP
eukprot:TRINITY_DN40924_c0_g1_i1.p1 TRINITY_DN40924_c0_g1~~TRINITY_DN40924_c0_g1_i1.p1  ORF type:complete len:445 (-),score=36.30 TRINITY_DN40924_c0_g1_i1:60-1196(-)